MTPDRPKAERRNFWLPADVAKALRDRAKSGIETASGYITRLVREDQTKTTRDAQEEYQRGSLSNCNKEGI